MHLKCILIYVRAVIILDREGLMRSEALFFILKSNHLISLPVRPYAEEIAVTSLLFYNIEGVAPWVTDTPGSNSPPRPLWKSTNFQ